MGDDTTLNVEQSLMQARWIVPPAQMDVIEQIARQHGLPEIVARLGGTGARVIACGHSHVPRLVHLPDGTAIVNPGSVGLPAYTDDGLPPHISETGSPLAR